MLTSKGSLFLRK